ncbi:TetR/AcrR family transcriptional regulator [Streptacidiphilus sp. PB12-B1b]|uniref:TetR/AcrR family transcriptional regulator n=1 Tax=Streptacidiphilus sp. PB12-B1b TaxID=2705012 RepID=UPI0015F93363|nr:TetR/AcrR family transcriptional regulator [Streptacidiphilus sp. PB12-B1b]QMU76852.1 TetR/AcrR family transcriptional regulator [Streptacidiphilus sp. PB12-B1b]
MDAVPEQTKKPRNTKRQREAGEAARRETKRQLLVAATEVFPRRGYAATPVSAVAEHAGVSVQTLYLAWGSKRELFTASVLAQLTGNGELEEPAWRRTLLEQLTAARQGDTLRDHCAALAAVFCTIAQRAAPAWKLIRDAAGSDPAIADEWRTITLKRHETTAALLQTFPVPAPGPDLEAAVDAVWVLAGPETFDLMVTVRGHSIDRFRTWLTDALERALAPG